MKWIQNLFKRKKVKKPMKQSDLLNPCIPKELLEYMKDRCKDCSVVSKCKYCPWG